MAGSWNATPTYFQSWGKQRNQFWIQRRKASAIIGATVGTIIIKEVKSFELEIENFTLIAALVGQQEEVLDKLELQTLSAAYFEPNTLRDIFFSLARASKEWKVHKVHFLPRLKNGMNIWPENLDIVCRDWTHWHSPVLVSDLRRDNAEGKEGGRHGTLGGCREIQV